MRILFDSQKTEYKTPFGCVTPTQPMTLCIHVPVSVGAKTVEIRLETESGENYVNHKFSKTATQGLYEKWECTFTIEDEGLYFYHFYIIKEDGGFRLFKAEDGTNMEEGEKWQISCVPADFSVPDWAKGAVIYQIFPDRFHKAGACDLTGKLPPYTIHETWDEEVEWKPTAKGEVLNNDFYGGNFRGITEKMDYIASLGVTILYLNPIGKAFSNHRYDTGDYKTPDPMLGTEADFTAMCDAAHAYGIKVVLDGVYSHTGADSLYFDKYGHFGGNGAYNSEKSPYFPWFNFKKYPDKYECWWDFDTLPTLNKMHSGVIDHIITGSDSVLAHWLKLGADGFRLDVVDELPDEFVSILKKHLRKLRPDALLMGEVWEDASNKSAYGVRRRYFTDGQLDSVMNYPYQKALIKLLCGQDDGKRFRKAVMDILENYPRDVALCNMNMLGTHDTPRILTALVDDFDGTRAQLAARKLSPEDKKLAKKRLMLASALQFMLPGSPSIYYGDEALMEGGKDPFNRRTYPWGREDTDLLMHFRSLGNLRKNHPAIRLGSMEFSKAAQGEIEFVRALGDTRIKIYVNLKDNTCAPTGRVLLQQSFSDCCYVITEEQ